MTIQKILCNKNIYFHKTFPFENCTFYKCNHLNVKRECHFYMYKGNMYILHTYIFFKMCKQEHNYENNSKFTKLWQDFAQVIHNFTKTTNSLKKILDRRLDMRKNLKLLYLSFSFFLRCANFHLKVTYSAYFI